MNPEIDAAILECAWANWMKVARLLADVSKRIGAPEDRPRFNEIADRIQALAATGKLESRGNLARWRFSEVRLPPAAAEARFNRLIQEGDDDIAAGRYEVIEFDKLDEWFDQLVAEVNEAREPKSR